MKKLNYFAVLTLILIFSCRNESPQEPNPYDINAALKGNWKPSYYELKGKVYQVSTCQSNGLITINSTMNGSYDVIDKDIANNCQTVFTAAGSWKVDSNTGNLILSYNENSTPKTVNLSLSTVNDTELRINDSSKNVDGTGGLDDAVLVYKKN